MTRAEELEKRMLSLSTDDFTSLAEFSAYSAGYMDGAKWADSTMIDRACEVLREKIMVSPDIVYLFRNAMNEL